MDIDIDIYFWMVDRGVFDDDQRNKVDLDNNKVKMFREHSQKVENGVYLGKLMILLKKSVMLKQNKPFSLDPNLGSLKDNAASSTKQANWTIIIKELKKFGIKVNVDKRQKIVEGRVQLISEILSKLFDFDNGTLPPETGKFDGNTSEIHYGVPDRDSLSLNGRLGGQQKRNKQDNMSFEVGTLDNSFLQGAPSKKATLEPLNNNSKASLQALPKSNNGSISVPRLSNAGSEAKIKQIQQQLVKSVNRSPSGNKKANATGIQISNVDQKKDLSEVHTTLEFILNSLANSLEIQPKQAAGLLANNHKYLMHIMTKGMKGGDFSKVYTWYQQIYPHTQVLCKLIDNEKHENAMTLTLNIIKCGLYSTQLDLAVLCSKVLAKIGKDINDQTNGAEMAGLAWEWFVETEMSSPNIRGNYTNLDNIQVLDLDMGSSFSPNKGPNQISSQLDSGLKALVQANTTHNQSGEFLSSLVSVMVQFGKNNYMELFIHQLNQQMHVGGIINKGQVDYMELVNDICALTAETSIGKDVILGTGVFEEWISLALNQADYDGQNSTNERMSALAFLQHAWEMKPELIEHMGDTAQQILTLFKRGCRDRAKILRIFSCDQMFYLLQVFALQRNAFAPIIYKSLTFMLIEFHTDIEMREQMIRHFTTVFAQIQTVPIAILCEPLIKQIQISDGSSYAMNVFDFDFFLVIVRHKRTNLQISASILEAMFGVAKTDIFFSKSAIMIILAVVERFSKDPSMLQILLTNITECLSEIEEQETLQNQQDKQYQTMVKQKQQADEISMKGTNNKYAIRKIQESSQQQLNQEKQVFDTAKLARVTRQRLIVNIIKQILGMNNQFVNQDIRMQLLTIYTRIDNTIQVKSKAIAFLLKFFKEDLAQMLQYFVSHNPQVQTQNNKSDDQHYYTMDAKKDNDQRLGIQSFVDSEEHSQSPLRIKELIKDNNASMNMLVPYASELSNSKKGQLEGTKVGNKSIDRLIQGRALKDIDKIKSTKMQQSMRKMMEEQLKNYRFEQQKSKALQQVEERKIEHGVVPRRKPAKIGQGRGLRASQEGVSPDIKIIKAAKIIDHDDEGILSKGQRQEIKLFDIRLEEQQDQDAVRFFIKKHIKILRNLFTTYSNTASASSNVQTFQALQIKSSLLSVAETLKMHKDFRISNIQVSQDEVKQIFRLINMQILKKNDQDNNGIPGVVKASLAQLDFEGFVEYMLQLAVHLYSFESQMTPVEYMKRLLDHMKNVAKETGNRSAKLFDDPTLSTIGDQQLLAEMNKRLQNDPNFKLPEGYIKVVDKEVINNFQIPAFVPIKQSKRIVIEVLDQILFDKFGFHFIEPMTTIKETTSVKQMIAHQAKDPLNTLTINQQQSPQIKSYMKPKISTVSQSRQSLAIKNNKTMSVEPNNRNNRNTIGGGSLSQSPSRKRGASQIFTARINTAASLAPVEKIPTLGINIKLEVAKAPVSNRAHVLQTAYVLEEILQAVENGLKKLPPRQLVQKNQIINRVTEQKIQKEYEGRMQQMDSQNKLEQRKQLLKQQLEKMTADKALQNEQSLKQKKLQEKRQRELSKKKEEEKRKFLDQAKNQAEAIKNKRLEEQRLKQEEEERKQKIEQDKIKQTMKTGLQMKKGNMQEEFKKMAQERKFKEIEAEEQKKRDEEKEKARKAKIALTLGNKKNKRQSEQSTSPQNEKQSPVRKAAKAGPSQKLENKQDPKLEAKSEEIKKQNSPDVKAQQQPAAVNQIQATNNGSKTLNAIIKDAANIAIDKTIKK